MYQVKVYHYREAIVKGDLEDEHVLEKSELFKTRKSAKDFIESEVRSESRYADKPVIRREYHKGNERSYVYLWTGDEWQHENSGEMCQEYYTYVLEKAKLR
jgi:hypothetical protein